MEDNSAGTVNDGYTAMGTVYWYGTGERAAKAVVAAVPGNGETRLHEANNDGVFRFEQLAEGEWVFSAFHASGLPNKGQPQQIKHDTDALTLVLFRTMGQPDKLWGWSFFLGAIALLVILIVGYLYTHMRVRPTADPINPALAVKVDYARKQLAGSSQLSTDSELKATMASIDNDISKLLDGDQQALTMADRVAIQAFYAAATEMIGQNNAGGANDQLAALSARLQQPTSPGFFWSREPWRFVEVMLWGLAGVLINLIITSGTYLRWGRFYREGLSLHLAQLLTVPLTALVIVLLLSLATLRITLSNGNEVQLDLSDARVLAAVSFLIGANPLAMWRFIRDTSQTVLKPNTGAGKV